MAYPRGRRTPLKRRATYGRGTKRYAQARYRRAYFNRRRGVGRKEKKGADVPFTTETVLSSTNTNGGIYLLNGIQEGVGSWNRIGRYMWNKSIELDLTLRYTSSYGHLTPTSPAENGCEQYWYGISSPTTVRSQPLTPSLDKRHKQESNQRP